MATLYRITWILCSSSSSTLGVIGGHTQPEWLLAWRRHWRNFALLVRKLEKKNIILFKTTKMSICKKKKSQAIIKWTVYWTTNCITKWTKPNLFDNTAKMMALVFSLLFLRCKSIQNFRWTGSGPWHMQDQKWFSVSVCCNSSYF